MAPRRPGLRRTKPKGAQAQVNASKLMRPRRVLSLTLLLLGIASVFGVVLLLQKTDLREVATQAGTNGGLGEREALSEPASSEIRALFVPLLDPALTPEEKDRLLRQESANALDLDDAAGKARVSLFKNRLNALKTSPLQADQQRFRQIEAIYNRPVRRGEIGFANKFTIFVKTNSSRKANRHGISAIKRAI
ncbi:MAG: hypothetical protein IIA65_09825 [Planctomycetes bacterium]|nr:hypothetical protein [Planctomycetota bacterium]